MKHVYMERSGEIVEYTKEQVEELRPMNASHLKRLVKHATPNNAVYIDIFHSGMTIEAMRANLRRAGEESGVKVVTFVADNYMGFVVAKIDEVHV